MTEEQNEQKDLTLEAPCYYCGAPAGELCRNVEKDHYHVPRVVLRQEIERSAALAMRLGVLLKERDSLREALAAGASPPVKPAEPVAPRQNDEQLQPEPNVRQLIVDGPGKMSWPDWYERVRIAAGVELITSGTPSL